LPPHWPRQLVTVTDDPSPGDRLAPGFVVVQIAGQHIAQPDRCNQSLAVELPAIFTTGQTKMLAWFGKSLKVIPVTTLDRDRQVPLADLALMACAMSAAVASDVMVPLASRSMPTPPPERPP